MREPGIGTRVAVVAAVSAGYLAAYARPLDGLPPVAWAFAAAAVVATAGAAKAPVPAVAVLAALLASADAAGVPASAVVLMKILLGLAMCEAAARRGLRTSLWTTGLAVAAYAAHTVGSWDSDSWGALFRSATVIAAPVLLGLLAHEKGARAEAEVRAARSGERTAIARELHDLVAHHLASMVLRTGVARHVAADADEEIREVLDDVHTGGTEALRDLRALVAVLRAGEGVGAAGFPDEPVSQAVGDAAERALRLGATVESTVDPGVDALPATVSLAVVRLAQEGLANAVRHGGGRARLSVAVKEGDVVFRLSNTMGSKGNQGDGFGLVGLRERVAVFGGEFSAGPVEGEWVLRARIPAPEVPS
ncbi:sensor histidine kinase [Salininema proteolyticum]|uniref:histidine kinase n=1 Tax=Salininema proteolyticum TaxID=1607685 RepID=A0ABV8U110_9ACTN